MAERRSGSQSGGEGGNRSANQPLSLREFGRRIGVSGNAVRKAVKSGRLKESLAKDGRIGDFARAQQEWTQSSKTGAGTVRTSVPTGSQATEARQPPAIQPSAQPWSAAPERDEIEADEEVPSGGNTLFEAQRISTLELARKRKLENDVTEGRLVSVDLVAKEAFEAERIIREGVLNVTARIAGQLAAETDPGRVHLILEASLREALNTTSDGLLAAINA